MEIPKIGIDFKDMRQSDMIYNHRTDIVLIDRQGTIEGSMLYVLKESKTFSAEDLEAIRNGFLSFHQDDFSALGEILTLNKRTKTIILKNRHTVSYKYLIIANKNSLVTYEVLAGIQTLVSALKLSNQIPASFAIAPAIKKSKKHMGKQVETGSDQALLKKIKSSSDSRSDISQSNIRNHDQTLFEVQL